MADWQSVYESQFADGTLVCQQLGAQEAWGLSNRFCQRRPLRISCLYSSSANILLAKPYFTNPPSINCSFLAASQRAHTHKVPSNIGDLYVTSFAQCLELHVTVVMGKTSKNWAGWKLLPTHFLGSLHSPPCSWQEWFPCLSVQHKAFALRSQSASNYWQFCHSTAGD